MGKAISRFEPILQTGNIPEGFIHEYESNISIAREKRKGSSAKQEVLYLLCLQLVKPVPLRSNSEFLGVLDRQLDDDSRKGLSLVVGFFFKRKLWESVEREWRVLVL